MFAFSIRNSVTSFTCDLVKLICDIFLKKNLHKNPTDLITFVPDRLGHDKRYAINYDKLKHELNWEAKFDFRHALSITIDWYFKTNV